MAKKKAAQQPQQPQRTGRGGPRVAGPGKRMGRPPTEEPRSTPRAIRISAVVNEYLSDVGSGIVEDVLRKSKGFRDWFAARSGKKQE